jgi:hypothetical protein
LQKSCWAQRRVGLQESYLIQELLSVERIPLGRAEAGVAIYSESPYATTEVVPFPVRENQRQSQRQRTGVSALHEQRRFAPRTAVPT